LATKPTPASQPITQALTSPETWWRLAVYGLTLALVVVAIGLARREVVTAAASSAVATSVGGLDVAPTSIPLTIAEFAPPSEDGELTRLADVHTFIPDRPRYEIEKYTVVKNDTLFIIASKFNLDPETILWGNAKLADNPNILSVGMELNILPINGALRVVQPGDTLEKIAVAFHGEVDKIVNFPGNDLDPTDPQIKEGQTIIIPDGWRDSVVWQLPVISRAGSGYSSSEPGACAGPFSGPSGTYTFVWPAGNHYLSGTDYLPVGHPGGAARR
jgi:LysM repeat protein